MSPSRLNVYLAFLCMAVLSAKFALIWRININWDEFYYLSHIYTFVRGESARVFQQAYVHLFTWLTEVGDDEIDQIMAGRIVMWLLLSVTAVLIAKLASRWVPPGLAWFAPLTFLTFAPVLRHSASFRSDGLIAPLALVTLVALTSSNPKQRRWLIAGGAFGLAVAVSLKAFLLLPMFLLFLATVRELPAPSIASGVRLAAARCGWFSAAAAGTAGAALLMHWATLPAVEPGAIQGFAARAASKTLLDVPLWPRWSYLRTSLQVDWICWLLVAGGFAVALAKRSRAAVCALALLPLLFYRNAYPYYYVVMLAPASVLGAVAVHATIKATRAAASAAPTVKLPAAIAVAASLPLVLQAMLHLGDLRIDLQESQRRTIESVHHIFDEPVAYIDHSGMIASFPKANFFMSSWGVEDYRARGESFMTDALDRLRPPLLVANKPLLLPRSAYSEALLEEDRRLIESSYVPYWGLIMVAGTEVVVPPKAGQPARLPFPGRYRLESGVEVLIDGAKIGNGDVITVGDDALELPVWNESHDTVRLRLVWAAANPNLPDGFPPYLPVYSPL